MSWNTCTAWGISQTERWLCWINGQREHKTFCVVTTRLEKVSCSAAVGCIELFGKFHIVKSIWQCEAFSGLKIHQPWRATFCSSDKLSSTFPDRLTQKPSCVLSLVALGLETKTVRISWLLCMSRLLARKHDVSLNCWSTIYVSRVHYAWCFFAFSSCGCHAFTTSTRSSLQNHVTLIRLGRISKIRPLWTFLRMLPNDMLLILFPHRYMTHFSRSVVRYGHIPLTSFKTKKLRLPHWKKKKEAKVLNLLWDFLPFLCLT